MTFSNVVAKSSYKIPNSLKIFFLVSQLCFGIDFGFTQMFRWKYRRSIKILTFIASCIMMGIITCPITYMYWDAWFWFNSIKYILFFVILTKLKYNVYNLIVDVNNICEFKQNDVKYLSGIAVAYIFIIDGIKCLFMAVRCSLEDKPYCANFSVPFYCIYTLPVFSLDAIGVTQTIIYAFIKCCIKSIKEMLKNTDTLKIFEKLYLSVVDCYWKIKPLYDFMVLLQLFIMVPKLMATIWAILLYVQQTARWYTYVKEFVFAFHLTIQICTPAIVAELVNSQVDSAKQILKEKLLTEKDERKLVNIRYTLQVVETKPLQHLVLRFIPVDVRLLLCLFSFCTSYFIVIVQFSHMY